MKTLKFQILSEFKTPLPLQRADGITLFFNYENGTRLEKSLVNVVDAQQSLISVEVSDFEIQGLPIGNNQSVFGKVRIDGDDYLVHFKGLDVGLENGRKKIL